MHLMLAKAKALLGAGKTQDALPVLTDAGSAAQRLSASDVQMEALELKAKCHESLEEPIRALDCLKELMHLRDTTRKAEQEARLNQIERSMTAEFAVREAKMLKAKNDELDFKNRTITESINYASLIQQAILPSVHDLQRLLPGSFLFFRPRDIVSGDFYWMGEVEGRVIVAVGDCTGHGVPGAFMSMIGTDMLNHIIFESHVHEPAEILYLLHDRVRAALRQDRPETVTQDGMELAILSIDRSTGRIDYSGAPRPLWVYRKSDGNTFTLEEIKPDRLSIGGQRYTEESTFTPHTVQLNPGDVAVCFSDGIQDQFNAANNAKFSARRLRETLATFVQDEPMDIAHHIANEVDMWQGGAHQTDDMILFGFKG